MAWFIASIIPVGLLFLGVINRNNDPSVSDFYGFIGLPLASILTVVFIVRTVRANDVPASWKFAWVAALVLLFPCSIALPVFAYFRIVKPAKAATIPAIVLDDEHPQRIIGRRVQLAELESGPLGLDPNQSRLPPANVESFGPDGRYSLRFQLPATWLGKRETHATISSRHVGYPVSSAVGFDRRCIAVAGYFGSGEAFVGLLRVLKESEG